MKSAVATVTLSLLLSCPIAAQQARFDAKPLVEKKVTELPTGPLFWRIETFSNLQQATAAAGSTSLVAEAEGKIWLFNLGPAGKSAGGHKVADVGPLPEIKAPEYLLRVNFGKGTPGGKTAVHTHPGSEAFYVLDGEISQKTAHGTGRVTAGEPLVGHGADTPMEVWVSGSTDATWFALFVVDANRQFTSPARFD